MCLSSLVICSLILSLSHQALNDLYYPWLRALCDWYCPCHFRHSVTDIIRDFGLSVTDIVPVTSGTLWLILSVSLQALCDWYCLCRFRLSVTDIVRVTSGSLWLILSLSLQALSDWYYPWLWALCDWYCPCHFRLSVTSRCLRRQMKTSRKPCSWRQITGTYTCTEGRYLFDYYVPLFVGRQKLH